MNLDDLRTFVRSQLETDEQELPNALLDNYLRDAYSRTIQLEGRWPFFESAWSLATVAEQTAYTLDATVDSLTSVYDVTGQYPLTFLDHGTAEVAFGDGSTATGVPAYWSLWGTNIYLWPTPGEVRSISLRGHRKPLDWVSSGAAAEVDADSRLHLPLAYYAISLVYAQQEDDVLEAQYMTRYVQSAERARADIMRASQHRPIIMSGGQPAAVRRIAWDLP